MANVLIASLGDSPGVITALVDALLLDEKKKIEKVIPIYTRDTVHSSGEPSSIEELKKEFGKEGHYKGKIEFCYEGNYINGKDIGGRNEKGYASSNDFFKKAIDIIHNAKKEGHNVVVGIGGGRKTMSALMTYAALIEDIQEIYQVMVADCIENIGKPANWKGDKKVREKALHPKSSERWLVKLPTRSEIISYSERIREKGINAMNGIIIEKDTPAL